MIQYYCDVCGTYIKNNTPNSIRMARINVGKLHLGVAIAITSPHICTLCLEQCLSIALVKIKRSEDESTEGTAPSDTPLSRPSSEPQ